MDCQHVTDLSESISLWWLISDGGFCRMLLPFIFLLPYQCFAKCGLQMSVSEFIHWGKWLNMQILKVLSSDILTQWMWGEAWKSELLASTPDESLTLWIWELSCRTFCPKLIQSLFSRHTLAQINTEKWNWSFEMPCIRETYLDLFNSVISLVFVIIETYFYRALHYTKQIFADTGLCHFFGRWS